MTDRLPAELRIRARRQQGREDEPSSGILDSQSVKGADTVGRNSRGYDVGRKVNERKRFIVTDTADLLITVAVMAASWQDWDGAKTVMSFREPLRHDAGTPPGARRPLPPAP